MRLLRLLIARILLPCIYFLVVISQKVESANKNEQRITKILLDIIDAPIRWSLSTFVLFLIRHPRLRYIILVYTHKHIPSLYSYITNSIYKNDEFYTKDSININESNTNNDEDGFKRVMPSPIGLRIIYIYVDHTISCKTNTGVQRITRSIAMGLKSLGESVRYVKWDAASDRCVYISLSEREHLSNWNGPKLSDDEYNFYNQSSKKLIPAGKHQYNENNWLIIPEVTHLNDYSKSVMADVLSFCRQSGLKTGAVFYDGIPLRRDEFKKIRMRHQRYMKELLLVNIVWPISNWAANDLLSFWSSYEKADSKTIPELNVISLPGCFESEARPISISNEPLILSVGTIEPRKNQLLLIQAFNKYTEANPESNWQLILIGNLHPSISKEIRQNIKNNKHVTHLGHISDMELDRLYKLSSFTVFPSIEEGFGLPILESLWYGKPCITANFGSMYEVAEGGGCYSINVQDFNVLFESLNVMIENKSLRESLSEEAKKRRIRTINDYAAIIQEHIDQDSKPQNNINKIYYWVDATIQYSSNTGIQRVARQLARSLIKSNINVIPVKWDTHKIGFEKVSQNELKHFSKWNGPEIEDWCSWSKLEFDEKDNWFIMPELPIEHSKEQNKRLFEFLKKYQIKSAAIFYDAIPWKMKSIYPSINSNNHYEYMKNLNNYDLVFAISNYSYTDLLTFLTSSLEKPQSLEKKIYSIPLAGEFIECSRKAIKKVSSDKKLIKILCVGTVEPRKNHEILIESFKNACEVSERSLHLTIVGNANSIDPTLEQRIDGKIQKHKNLIWVKDSDDEKLEELYKECDFTIYPSIEEGFGLPILESIWNGKPCICANFGAMFESAKTGGCLTVNVKNSDELKKSIITLANDRVLLNKLTSEISIRKFKTWQQYSFEIISVLAENSSVKNCNFVEYKKYNSSSEISLIKQPLLSICISTYNRADWLAVNLNNWVSQYPNELDNVQLLVCDNASTDHTEAIIQPYIKRKDFAYYKNSHNVGMLGNLRKTTEYADGAYIWIIGDDDLIIPGAVENILKYIKEYENIPLIYLNYAFTKIEDAHTIKSFDDFFKHAKPIVPSETDRIDMLNQICTRNENFFTAIYTLVFRRDHALKCYSQNTSGRPFSSMLTSIPTTYYVLNNLMEEQAIWIGNPQIVVNMNVSWLKYAPLWILERIPEVYELAEEKGVPAEDIDRWRKHTLPGISHYFHEIYTNDPYNNAEYFSAARLVRRFKHLPEFAKLSSVLKDLYTRAYNNKHPGARTPISQVFPEQKVNKTSLNIFK